MALVDNTSGANYCALFTLETHWILGVLAPAITQAATTGQANDAATIGFRIFVSNGSNGVITNADNYCKRGKFDQLSHSTK
jgi:hypothetical protein